MTAQPSSQAEREDEAREVLATTAQGWFGAHVAASVRQGSDPYWTPIIRAMLAFSDREHATPRSMPEEVDHGR